jgi:hypothetical protein
VAKNGATQRRNVYDVERRRVRNGDEPSHKLRFAYSGLNVES